jgi:hypothetical protein
VLIIPSFDPKSTFLTLGLTCNDSAQPINFDPDIYYEDVNIHVYGAPVYYGSPLMVEKATQGAATPNCSNAVAGSVISFQKIRIKDIWFKNFTNLANATVIASGATRV